MWQSALIGALVGAAVALIIKYATEPYLEARKGRVADDYRLRRECLTRTTRILLNLPYFSGESLLPYSWESGKKTLESISIDVKELCDIFAALYPSFSRRQRTIIQDFLISMATAVNVTRKQVLDVELRETDTQRLESHVFHAFDLGFTRILIASKGVRDTLTFNRNYFRLYYWRGLAGKRPRYATMKDLQNQAHRESRTFRGRTMLTDVRPLDS